METISHHTYYLAKDFYKHLRELKHKNGNPAAILYMDSEFNDISKQGGIVTFNLVREDRSYIGYTEVCLNYSISVTFMLPVFTKESTFRKTIFENLKKI